MRLATLLALVLALPAAAQSPGDYAVFATQAELDDGGTLSGAVPTCLLAGSTTDGSAAFFWDATSEVFAVYDATAAPGERTSVPVAAFLIDLAAGTNVTTCRDAVPEVGPDGVPTGVAFFVLSDEDDEDFVARVDAASQAFTVLTDRGDATDAGDGISGVAQIGTTLYLARQQFFGAPEDGIYAIDTTTEEQVPTAVVTNPGMDLVSIVSSGFFPGPEEVLFASSSEFGDTGFQNVILLVEDPDGTPALSTYAAPCVGAEPVFTDCEDGGLEDLASVLYRSGDIAFGALLAVNNSFNGPLGETIGVFPLVGDEPGYIEAAESELIAQTGIAGYTTPASSGYLSVTSLGDDSDAVIYLAGSDAFGGTPGIFSFTPAPGILASGAAPEGAFELSVTPNPAVGAARLAVTPEAGGALRVDVLDALGRAVATLFDGPAAAGGTVALRTPELAPGVYVVRVRGAAGVTTERFTVAR